jgi:hypothetical protein
MREEIENGFQEKKLRAKRIKHRMLKAFFCILMAIVILILLYFFVSIPENIKSLINWIIVGLLYGLYISGHGCIHPLNPEERAFCEIYSAIELLEKSNNGLFLEETLNHLKKAYKLLRRVDLKYTSFYRETNFEVKRLVEIMKGTIHAAQNRELESGHLEQIASALIKPTLESIKSVNDQLWDKYHGKELQEFGLKYHVSKFYATTLGKVTVSLVFGYGLIILISLIYCLVVGIDFILFSKENPSIIIMGGAILSGISFFGKK